MEAIQDGFLGFGEGFEGFPKRLPNDCVEYSLFLIDAKLHSQRERLTRLEKVRKEASSLAGNLLKDYIWQRDTFDLKVENENGLMCLRGVTNYGDSVEDEWLIVYILLQLSKSFSDLWIKVVDADGEFLLIEAANALPKWLNPEIADNRVWIHNNQLRIIPLAAAASPQSDSRTLPLSRSLSLDEALKIIASSSDIAFNSPMIEEEAFYRIQNYPSQITASLHHALATIPRKLAYILHRLPASVAPAVEAFYLRDPISLKSLQANPSQLVFCPTDLVTVSVRFTKILFAQLRAQQFSPPMAWKDTTSQASRNDEYDGSMANQYELGMKVTSGFEMLVTDPKNRDDRRVREIMILLEDLAPSDSSELPSDTEIASWPNSKRADDEKWLDINFDDFENELQGKNKKKKAGFPGAFGPEEPSGFGDAKTQLDLKKIVERFEAFLNDDEAGLDGAEIDEMDVDDEEEDEDSENEEDEDREVSFDEEEFARMMREMMGLPSTEDLADLPPAEGSGAPKRIEEINTDEDGEGEDEESEIREVMKRMERELNDAGALNLDPTPSKLAALKPKRKLSSNQESEEEGSGDEADIDFNLVKNLLESFKSQGGMAGPGGNMLGMMGMQLPRDDDEKKGHD